jgi:hypothetical protein
MFTHPPCEKGLGNGALFAKTRHRADALRFQVASRLREAETGIQPGLN